MADKRDKMVFMKAALAVVILFVVWLILRKTRPVQNVSLGDIQTPDFSSPYYWTTPGVYPGTEMNFNSNNNVTVQSNLPNGLSNSYMPLFGLVGMTAVKG